MVEKNLKDKILLFVFFFHFINTFYSTMFISKVIVDKLLVYHSI